MRTVTFGAANSLDGYIAREDQGVDWLHWSDDVAALVAETWKGFDACLWGRKSYEAAERLGGGPPTPGVRHYVFSRTLEEVKGWAELVRGDAAEFVRRLKEAPGRGICVMGGGELARSLFAADLIDEVGVNVQPVLLGGGIPLFPPLGRQIDLELKESRTLAGGCVYALYKVRRAKF